MEPAERQRAPAGGAGRRLDEAGKYHPIYPYGTLPRLLLIWISSTAVKTRSPTLILGSSLTEFMRHLGLTPTGGKTGAITRLRDQMERLLKARLSVEIKDGAHRDIAGQISIALKWGPVLGRARQRESGDPAAVHNSAVGRLLRRGRGTTRPAEHGSHRGATWLANAPRHLCLADVAYVLPR